MPSVLIMLLGSLLFLTSGARAASAEEITQWIAELGSPTLRTRQAAEQKLWAAGLDAYAALDAASRHRQPEIAFRSAKIARYLHLGLTPETPAEIVTLAKEFAQLSVTAKQEALQKLKGERRYRLALQLAYQEKNRTHKPLLQRTIQGLSIIAARDALLKGDTQGARRFLTDFPDDPRNTMALAWLARCDGTLETEIAAAGQQKAPGNHHRLIALLRLKGDLAAVAELAQKNQLTELAASMKLLEGQPEPWLQWHADNVRGDAADLSRAYVQVVLHQLRHHQTAPDSAIQLLTKTALKQGDYVRRWAAIQALTGLGIEQPSRKAIKSLNPTLLFQAFAEQERIDDALAAFDLDPKNPDYHSWISQRLDAISKDEDEHEMDSVPNLISFLEKRGISEPIDQVFLPRMLTMAENDPETFTDLLSLLYSADFSSRLAPETATKIAVAYAKEDDLLWGSILRIAFTDNPFFTQWWQWLGEISPTTSRGDRFRHMLVLFRVLPDRKRELPQIELQISKALENDPADAAETHRKLCAVLAAMTRITRYARWAYLDESEMDADDLMNLGQWELAAVKWESALKVDPDSPHSLLWSALCWRKAQQEQRAQSAEKQYHTLVLGDTSMMVAAASIYQYLGYTKQADEWTQLALRTSPRSPVWFSLLYQNAEKQLLQGNWRVALAGYEAYSLVSLENSTGTSLASALRIRKKADMARGFSLLSSQPDLALSILRECHQVMLADASLADQFFPALRLAGARKEHDAWFEESWQQFMRIRDRFPQDDNLRNSAAWLASRALKRLNEAEREVKVALKLRPNQASYLDTLAEICFAQRNRDQAVSWSEKALIADPSATPLREQYYRFLRDSFPQ